MRTDKTVQLLQPSDIFDLYGCEYLLTKAALDDADKRLVEFRVNEIKDLYVASCRSRIIAEARFLGIKVDSERSLSEIMEDARAKVFEMVQQQTSMFGGGPGPNLMQTVLKAHMAAGSDMRGINLAKFGLSAPQAPDKVNEMEKLSTSLMKDPKWHLISKAYLDVESAVSVNAIIMAIDKLNSLQHHAFHVLIDLQSGRMLSDFVGETDQNTAMKNVKDILDLRMQAKTPFEFLDKMSSDLQELFKQYRPR